MYSIDEKIKQISEKYHQLKNNPELAKENAMPGKAYFINEKDILSIARDNGDSRYPMGHDGFNFWAYTSGYMHSNEGLFSTFLRAAEGQEPRIAFFAGFPKASGSYSLVPLLSVPRLLSDEEIPVEQYTVFTEGAAYYITEMQDFRFAVRVFVDDKKVIRFTIHAQNLSNNSKKLFISSFLNPFIRHAINETGEDRWFREVKVLEPNAQGELESFLVKVNEDISRKVSVSNYGIIHRYINPGNNNSMESHTETASRYDYVGGSRSSLHTPYPLIKGTFENPKQICAFTDIGVAGDILHLNIGADNSVRLDIELIHCFNDEELSAALIKNSSPEAIDHELFMIEQSEREKQTGLIAKIEKIKEGPLKENVFNAFFEHLKKQVEFCSLIKGYIQLSPNSLIGIRDVFQAIEGLLFWQPEAARQKMLEAFEFIAPNGRCPRQYSLPANSVDSPAMDLRPFIDQGVWVISTMATYLRFTGDFDILNEECGYYDIVDEKAKLVKKSTERDSVLEHMFRIMDYLLENRDHGHTDCVCALYGDWNDALDGLGVSKDPNKEYGTGVSVMVTLQVYQNLKEMTELLKKLDAKKYESYIAKYNKALKEIEDGLKKHAIIENEAGEKRIVHGWGDEKSYFVGGFNDPDGQPRDGLTSNAFWVLSGLYEKDTGIGETILNAFERLDSKYGYKTFEPFFPQNTPGVGRIPKLPAGTAENGATYIHATTFAIMALFRMGQPEKAWEQLYKVMPFLNDNISCSPFIMPNSYGYNEEKLIDGESMADWQTGSSNVILKTLIRFIFGIEPEFDGVWIQPTNKTPYGAFEFKIRIKGCEVNLSYKNTGTGKRTFEVNGVKREGSNDTIMGIDKLWLSDQELRADKLSVNITD